MQRKHVFRSFFAIGAISVLAGCPVSTKNMIPPTPSTPVPYVYRVYIAEYGLDRVEAFDQNGTSLATIPTGTGSHPSRLTYDGNLGALWAVNTGSGTVTRIDPKTNKAIITISLGGSPVDAVVSPNSSHLLYVADGSSNSVAVVDESSNSVIGHITTSGRPFSVQANSAYVAIAQSDNAVALVDDTKPSITPVTTIKTTLPLAGIALNDSSEPAIETNDGALHLYNTSNGGALPWTPDVTVKLAKGAAQLDSTQFTDDYTLLYASQKLVEVLLYDPTAPSQTFSMNVGDQPGWPGNSDSGATNGATFFVPNAGDDTVSAFTPNYHPYATWHLAAGAHPVAALGIFYVGASTPTPSPAPTATPTPTTAPTATPTSGPTASGHLYVANGSGGNLLEYTAPFTASSTPTVNVNIGGNIWGVAANASYVAVEDNSGFIYLFAQPLTAGSSPVAQFQGGGSGGQLLFDAAGNLYSSTLGAVTLKFSPPFSNSTVPSATISGSTASFSLAMDGSSNLYVGNLGANEIDVFAPPYTGAPTRVMQPGTYSLAYDQNALYGADAMNNAIDLYSLPLGSASTPVFTIPVTDPHALAFDSVGNLYAADQTDKKIEVFAQPFGPTSAPTFSITSGITEPVQIDAGP